MFVSFFPRPKPYFISVAVWAALVMALWYGGARHWGMHVGLAEAPLAISAIRFVSPSFLWFYLYYAVAVGLFAAAWQAIAPHPWWRWSILGSALIVLGVYMQVEVTVLLNAWRGPFFDMLQLAVSKPHSVTEGQFYSGIAAFMGFAMVGVFLATLNAFFTSHYCFRWRTAMNDFYMSNWDRLRTIEGAAQRVQDDTMRFAMTTEDMGVSMINSVMTLIAFLPLLVDLSVHITALPLVGKISHPLVVSALLWSALGTAWLASIGIKLPGLAFLNQRTEAALRKELVYGEDDASRATPPTVAEMFGNVRRSWYRYYFHTVYFNLGRIFYLQLDAMFVYVLLTPSFVAGALTLGLWQQIATAFGEVSASFQYLVTNWPTMIDLISIYKRLLAFESTLHEKPLDKVEHQNVETA